MRWLNKYHKGFNRLWLVFSIVGVFAFVGFNWLKETYNVSFEYPSEKWVKPLNIKGAPDFDEWMLSMRSTNLWHKWFINEKKSPADETVVRARILKDVQSMKEARSFTKIQLNAVVDNAITYKKQEQAAKSAYSRNKRRAQTRRIGHLLGAFIMTFAIGHGVFYLIIWIIRGFR